MALYHQGKRGQSPFDLFSDSGSILFMPGVKSPFDLFYRFVIIWMHG